jgi:hypothetical protein
MVVDPWDIGACGGTGVSAAHSIGKKMLNNAAYLQTNKLILISFLMIWLPRGAQMLSRFVCVFNSTVRRKTLMKETQSVECCGSVVRNGSFGDRDIGGAAAEGSRPKAED